MITKAHFETAMILVLEFIKILVRLED